MPSKSENLNLKMFHAKVHFERLREETRAYYAKKPAIVVMHPESEPAKPSVKLETVIPVPDRIPLFAGDCLQNLRSCFDYLVWEMVQRSGKVPTRQAFPVCTTSEGWDAAKKRGLKDVPENAVRAIHGMQPYKRGLEYPGHPMYVLDSLTNVNKHRHLIVAMLGGTDMTTFVPGPDGTLWGQAVATRDGKIPSYAVDGQTIPQAEVAAFIAFKEGPAEGLDVGLIIGNLINWTDKFALPLFDSFL